MANSKRLAGLIGPTLIAISVTEAINLRLLTASIGPSHAPLVYLNGTLLFVAGLAIVRAHNDWKRGWPVLITLLGWLAMLGGLIRMIAPMSAQQAGLHITALSAVLIVLLAVGVFLSLKAYGREDNTTGVHRG